MKSVLAFALWTLAWFSAGAVAQPVTETSPNRMNFVIDGNLLRIPYYRNLPISASHPLVDRAAVMVHGNNRNAANSYDNLVAAAALTGIADSTAMFVAPHFLTEEDITALGLAPDVLFWDDQGWKQGDHSLSTLDNPRPATVSCFALMDSILYRIASKNPNLHRLVVAGHSAGGQFVQRYAAGNAIEQVLRSQFGVDLSYIVANPSSYMYLNPERPVSGSLTMFEVPPPTALEACPGYDQYKYGFVSRNSYMASISANQIIAQYAPRHVSYMLGVLDTDTTDPSLDTTCPAALEGPYRLARGVAYCQYLIHFYGVGIADSHRMILVPGVGHSSTGIFTSTCGAWLLFSGSYCSTLSGTDEPGVSDAPGLGFPNPVRGTASIRFRLPTQETPVALRLYDIRGRIVRTLFDGPRPSGPGSIFWNGCGDNGERLPAGIYVCRLDLGTEQVVRKITVLR